MTTSSVIDSNLTIRVNVLRALAAGLVWGGLAAGFMFFSGLFSWYTDPNSDWLNTLLSVPTYGIIGLFMPLLCLILTAWAEIILLPLNKIRILKFLVGLLIPNIAFVTALVMIVGDPLVYLLWRTNPPSVPVQQYKFIMFCSYIQVERESSENLPVKKPT
jgi:hypothetical protein